MVASWADRVNSEVKSAVLWEGDWGNLFKPGEPQGYGRRIKDLEAKLAKMPGSALMSTSRLQFQNTTPVREIRVPTAGAPTPAYSTTDPFEVLGSSGTNNSKPAYVPKD